MSDLTRILALATEQKHRRMALATVTATWGSAPRPRGSHMLVLEDGSFEGSVSGGCVENAILQEAAEIIAKGGFRKLRYGVSNAMAWEVGLPCGGEIEVIVQQVSPAGFPPELFQRLAYAQSTGETLQLTTDETGHTGEQDSPTGFTNLYRPPRRMLIVGAVQIAQSLAVYARELGLHVSLIDPRERYLTEARFPGITRDLRWPDEAVASLRPNAGTAIVTLSHDTKLDDTALAAALDSQAGYIAALGSRKSHAARLQRLSALGFTAQALERIEGPAGIPIGAIGPAEIALSIMAGAIRKLGAETTATAATRHNTAPALS